MVSVVWRWLGWGCSLWLCWFMVLTGSAEAAPAEPICRSPQCLCLAGSNTIGARLAPRLIEAFASAQGLHFVGRTEPRLDEAVLTFADGAKQLAVHLSFHGTSTGFAMLRDQQCDLWMASRLAHADEADALGGDRLHSAEQESVLALDGLAIIVHPDNPIRTLSRAQVQAVFTGAIRDWSALGGPRAPIALHARDQASGTFDTFKNLVLQEQPLASRTRRYESTEALSEAVAADPHAIGFVGLAGVGRNHALAIRDGDLPALAPTPFNIATEDYALARRLYLYSRAERTPIASAFLAFVQQAKAQEIVAQSGFVPLLLISQRVDLRDDAPREYRDLIADATRLSVSFRFGSGQVFLDSRAALDLDRVAAFMQAPERAGASVVLVGFAEQTEFSPIVMIGQSTDRADVVAQELVRRGVNVRQIRGYGAALPITALEGDSGRSRNRRVEVWIRPAGRES